MSGWDTLYFVTLELHRSDRSCIIRTAWLGHRVANGGDNIGIYAPSFAIRSRDEIAVIALVFVAMTAFWCFAAHSMVNHPKLGTPIHRCGHRFAPIVLIGLGILIIYQAGSLGLLLRHGGF